ncbi:MAG: TetR/AcrR family transcriptional regulator [Frankiales bacterium]|nr:TetR/AcrR family transcriptional regulator [Frankiales bacterium]
MVEQVSSPNRSYTMRARQDSVEETRRRITEATMRLHERVGPAATTVAAIAEAAGVTRLTVYRHFPDDEALVAACSAHWRALHPRPDVAAWAHVDDPVRRLRLALAETYEWARTAAPMMTKIHRDVDSMPAFVGEYLSYDEKARVEALATAFRAKDRAKARLAAALAHALHVGTWESLCGRGGLTDSEAVDVMTAAVLAALQSSPSR